MDRFQSTRLWGVATTYRMWSAATRGMASYAASWAAMAEMMAGRRKLRGKIAENKSAPQKTGIDKPTAAPSPAIPDAAAQPTAALGSVVAQSVPEQPAVAERKAEPAMTSETPPAVGSEAPPEIEVVHADAQAGAPTQRETPKEFTAPQAQSAKSGKKKKNRGAKGQNVQAESAGKKSAGESEPASRK